MLELINSWIPNSSKGVNIQSEINFNDLIYVLLQYNLYMVSTKSIDSYNQINNENSPHSL